MYNKIAVNQFHYSIEPYVTMPFHVPLRGPTIDAVKKWESPQYTLLFL